MSSVERDDTHAVRLTLSEEQLRLVQQAARIGAFEWNVRTGVNLWTPELEAMYGLAPGQFGKTQTSWEQLVHPDDRPAALAAVQRAFDTMLPAEGEWRVVWPDGTVRWVIGRFQVLAGDDGAPLRLIGANMDITERKRAEAALRESEAQKTAVMEAALDAIVLMDHHGSIVEVNAAAERVLGYGRGELVGRLLADVMIPDRLRAQHAAGLKRYLESGEQRVLDRCTELPVLRKDGSEFPAEVAIVRIGREGPPLFTGYIRDITERKRAADIELIRRDKEAAEDANAELEAFSYSVAHDLRAPLRVVSGFSAALLEDHGATLAEAARVKVQRMIDGTKRMSEIIDALLALAKLTRTRLRREPIDLVPVVHAIFEQIRAAQPEREVQLIAPVSLVVHADALLLRVLLENLLGNAFKFTRHEPRARIELGKTLSPRGSRAYFVRDNGAGFKMQDANKLFAPFQRLHSDDQFEGTGIGLATVQRVVRRHGGHVWAEGAENRGATIYFTLPDELAPAPVGGGTRIGRERPDTGT